MKTEFTEIGRIFVPIEELFLNGERVMKWEVRESDGFSRLLVDTLYCSASATRKKIVDEFLG